MSNYVDMLVKLGVGNAHPGGFASTIEQLEHFPIAAGTRVLEVGCGTGRTACYLDSIGCEVTGVDLREAMIDKAKSRAKEQQSRVQFEVADARSLPFATQSFDVVWVESVSVFAGSSDCFSEYSRVLREGGVLYDREIMRTGPIPAAQMATIQQFYGFSHLPNAEEWLTVMNRFFRECRLWKPSAFTDEMWKDEYHYPDVTQMIDAGSYADPILWDVVKQYKELMSQYADYFGYGLFICHK